MEDRLVQRFQHGTIASEIIVGCLEWQISHTDKLHKFIARRKFPYPILVGGELRQGVAAEYKIFGALTDILIAPDGRVHYVEVGFAANSKLGEVVAPGVACGTFLL